MKFLVVATFVLAVARASVIPSVGHIVQEIVAPVATSAVVQGPSTKTHLVGPDGSQILADAPGGTIVASEHAALAAVPVAVAPLAAVPVAVAPLVAAEVLLADPVVEVAAPVLEDKAIEVPVVEAKAAVADAVVEEVASPVIAKADLPAPGSGLEGQYVPDNTEKLYDDGSYKGDAEEEA